MEKIRLYLENFTEKIREIWKDNLVSIILYGSYLKENFNPKISDVNLIILVRDIDTEKLMLSRKTVQRFNRKSRIVPLFLSVDFGRSSFDSFALEWKEIREKCEILYGQDLVSEVRIEKEHLRLQMERELKENIIRFQQGLLFGWNLDTLLLRSGKASRIIYRNLKEVCAGEEISEVSEHFAKIEEMRRKRVKLGRQKMEELVGEHLAVLNRLAKIMEKTWEEE